MTIEAVVLICQTMVENTSESNNSSGTLGPGDISVQGTLSCGIFCQLTCKSQSDEGTPPMRDTFAVALWCPLIRGYTVHLNVLHICFFYFIY